MLAALPRRSAVRHSDRAGQATWSPAPPYYRLSGSGHHFCPSRRSATASDLGTIAYVRPSMPDAHLISPGSSGDRVLWTAPGPLSRWPAYDLAWRPDGRELAFSSEHE